MKHIILILILISTTTQIFAQDTTVTWLNNIDTSSFKMQYNKKDIPIEFYLVIRITKLKDIASSGESFQIGCVGYKNQPMKRLNWLAVDIYNHWILSVSHGGRGYGTDYYYIDKENKGQINVNCFSFGGSVNCDELTFYETLDKIKLRKFHRNNPRPLVEKK